MSIRSLFLGAAAAIGLTLLPGMSNASSLMTFSGSPESTVSASLTGNGGSAGGTVITATNLPISVGSFVGPTPTPFNAVLNFTLTSRTTASVIIDAFSGFRNVVQSYSGVFSITSGLNGTGANYVSGDFVDLFFGFGSAVTVQASTPGQVVNFTSGFDIPLGTPRAITFSFTNVSPAITSELCGPENDRTVCAFTSNVSGNLSSNTRVNIPTPGALGMFGMALVALGFAAVRRGAKIA